jgi:hypothetical protein
MARAEARIKQSNTILQHIYVPNRGSADSIANELRRRGFHIDNVLARTAKTGSCLPVGRLEAIEMRLDATTQAAKTIEPGAKRILRLAHRRAEVAIQRARPMGPEDVRSGHRSLTTRPGVVLSP